MNTSYTEALKEVATLAPNGEVMLDTITISHPTAGTINLVNDRQDLHARYESGGSLVIFQASSFSLALPESSVSGTQHLNLTVPNVDRAASDFLANVPTDTLDPVTVTYRAYLSGQLDTAFPENDPPIVLSLTDVEIDAFTVSGRASFQSVINNQYPSELYTLERFPALAS